MARMLISLFTDQEHARMAINELSDQGFNPKEISLIMRDNTGTSTQVTTGASVGEGALSGATTGGLLGALAGLLIGVAIPGLGGLLVGGPIAAALGLTGAAATTVSGAVTGALAGGLIGALVNLGIPEEGARMYEQRISEGAVLLMVPVTTENETVARSAMETHAEGDIRSVNIRTSDHTSTSTDEEIDLGASYGPTYASDLEARRKVRNDMDSDEDEL